MSEQRSSSVVCVTSWFVNLSLHPISTLIELDVAVHTPRSLAVILTGIHCTPEIRYQIN
jgi:hypothetical protein